MKTHYGENLSLEMSQGQRFPFFHLPPSMMNHSQASQDNSTIQRFKNIF
jgi:hypothetical protein